MAEHWVRPNGGGKVSADTQAKAARALASWQRKKGVNLSSIELRDFSAEKRRELKKEGHALDLGGDSPSYPIENASDWKNAAKLFLSRRKTYTDSQRAKVKRYLLKEARRLGVDHSSYDLATPDRKTEKGKDRRKTADGSLDKRSSAEAIKKKVENNPTTSTVKGGSQGANAKRVRSPQTGLFVEKFPERNVEGVKNKLKGRIENLSDGGSFTIPGSKNNAGKVEKNGSTYTVTSPSGLVRRLTSTEEAANLAMQIGSERV